MLIQWQHYPELLNRQSLDSLAQHAVIDPQGYQDSELATVVSSLSDGGNLSEGTDDERARLVETIFDNVHDLLGQYLEEKSLNALYEAALIEQREYYAAALRLAELTELYEDDPDEHHNNNSNNNNNNNNNDNNGDNFGGPLKIKGFDYSSGNGDDDRKKREYDHLDHYARFALGFGQKDDLPYIAYYPDLCRQLFSKTHYMSCRSQFLRMKPPIVKKIEVRAIDIILDLIEKYGKVWHLEKTRDQLVHENVHLVQQQCVELQELEKAYKLYVSETAAVHHREDVEMGFLNQFKDKVIDQFSQMPIAPQNLEVDDAHDGEVIEADAEGNAENPAAVIDRNNGGGVRDAERDQYMAGQDGQRGNNIIGLDDPFAGNPWRN